LTPLNDTILVCVKLPEFIIFQLPITEIAILFPAKVLLFMVTSPLNIVALPAKDLSAVPLQTKLLKIAAGVPLDNV
jgi:hypothetical protein